MHIPGVALGIVHGQKIVHLQGFGVPTPLAILMTRRLGGSGFDQ